MKGELLQKLCSQYREEVALFEIHTGEPYSTFFFNPELFLSMPYEKYERLPRPNEILMKIVDFYEGLDSNEKIELRRIVDDLAKDHKNIMAVIS